MKYRNVGNHAEDLADGRMIGPGEYVELSEEEADDPRAKDLIDSEVFLLIGEPKATDAAKALADEKGITLTSVTGTGKESQITERDVERAAREQGEEG
jgi:pyruvate/2-oxoglutarate dehydrogenase complex dihydrolipoamide acyltransferase (E2) component